MQAVTFDFYNTLAHHRSGRGRGREYAEYLAAAGLSSDAWHHQALYDVFPHYAAAYRPTLSAEGKLAFWTEFTRRLFERTNVRAAGPIDHAAHAAAIRAIIGPASFALFEEAPEVLRTLKRAGLRLAVVADWPPGLSYFCEELGIGGYLDAVVASGDVGFQKPDPRLFEEASARLAIPARENCRPVDPSARRPLRLVGLLNRGRIQGRTPRQRGATAVFGSVL